MWICRLCRVWRKTKVYYPPLRRRPNHLTVFSALDALSALTVQDKPADVFSTPPQLDGELVTFTLLPRSRWQTLLNLEVIQQRNKPKEPPKQPEKAPFFLPTLPGVDHRFAVDEKKAEEAKKPTKRLQGAAGSTESVFYKKLAEAHESESADCALSIVAPTSE